MLNINTLSQRTSNPISKPAIASNGAVADELGLMGAKMTYARNEEIFGEGEPAEYLYKVVSGAVRACKILDDGRRQVSAFYVPGDFFGLEFAAEHSSSCEAITNTIVLVFKRSAVDERAKRDGNVVRKLWEITAAELGRAQDHVLQLIRSAEGRISSFLLKMAARSRSANELELPMCRQDIADHLGLTIETVSRTLTQFTAAGLIGLPSSRHVVLRNRSALARLND
jgi:CRP/FNR family transcriptional regulator, nitrogen fixation regulation protein